MKVIMVVLCSLIAALNSMGQRADARDSSRNTRQSIEAKIRSGDAEALRSWVKLPCVGNYDVSITETQLDAKSTHLVAVVSSVGCERFAILIFAQTPDRATWMYKDSLRLPTRYGQLPRIEYPEMVEQGSHEIVLSDVAVDSGSGVDQEDYMILKLMHGFLSTVFDSPEHVNFVTQHREINVNNTFSLFESKPSNLQGLRFVRENQKVKSGLAEIQRVEDCIWDGELRHFVCVESEPAKHTSSAGPK